MYTQHYLVLTYFIAKYIQQRGWVTSSHNISFDPSHNTTLQHRFGIQYSIGYIKGSQVIISEI